MSPSPQVPHSTGLRLDLFHINSPIEHFWANCSKQASDLTQVSFQPLSHFKRHLKIHEMRFSCDFSMQGTALKPANSKWNETLLQDLFPARTASASSTCLSPGEQPEIKPQSNNAVCSAASAAAGALCSPNGCASVQDHHPDGEQQCFALFLFQKDL